MQATGRRTYLRVAFLGLLGSILGLTLPQIGFVSTPSQQGRLSTRQLLAVICNNCAHKPECRQLTRPKEEWGCVSRNLSKSLAVRSG